MKQLMIISTILLTISGIVSAGGLYGNAPTLFSDHRACGVGDVITIEIMEVASASNEASTDIKKEQSNKISSSGSGFLDLIPVAGLNNSMQNEYSGGGKSSRKGNLKAKITARIVAELPNGNYIIEGSRIVDVNGEKQTTVLTGVIRPQDITPQNTVYSYNIAEAQISYKGRGPVNTSQRPGILARVLNWIF